MNILGIESTCDETGIALVKDGKQILSNVVASSVNLHKKYGGVVPEVAAREQVRVIVPVLKEALAKVNLSATQIDAIACAYGPGLIGSLLIGVETAKTLALVWNKPLIPVNHLIGHVYANWLEGTTDYRLQTTAVDSRQSTVDFPAVALIVSGGHTDLILMKNHGKFQFLGGTRDDAAGEAFDKVARILGLPYPGGPEIEKLARNYNFKQNKFNLPLPMAWGDNFDFSFSGIKTAVFNLSKKFSLANEDKAEIAYKFQDAVCRVLVKKTQKAASKYKVLSIIVGGGVAANSELRRRMSNFRKNGELNVFFPEKELSIDNGVMIATCAYYLPKKVPPFFLKADPSLHF
ncbi:MAG TPA: tRNA (adenosine(37)-N6)-threonylcarbamoyltransferase complex transferase subunit TsaD [Patescibacteria group bacterium]|nr:tRNA (adenosine(37)-N6)-threonylcarbamoyltransferase complex transferase subunit TsaD [Patescibacteria group bacterium]